MELSKARNSVKLSRPFGEMSGIDSASANAFPASSNMFTWIAARAYARKALRSVEAPPLSRACATASVAMSIARVFRPAPCTK